MVSDDQADHTVEHLIRYRETPCTELVINPQFETKDLGNC